jgi:hypothetical protein
MHPTRRSALAAAALAALPRFTQAANPDLTLCTFSTEVTCPIGHPLMGGGIAPAKKIEEELFAHGFILQGKALGKPVAFVAVDWCEIRNGAYDTWRKTIAEAIGTEPVRVMVVALHQHDTPIADLEAEEFLKAQKCKGSVCDLDFHAKTVKKVAAEAKLSLKTAKPMTHLSHGEAEVKEIASNRRYTDKNGEVRYNRMSAARDVDIRAAEVGTIDPKLKSLTFWNGDTPLVTVHAYATHPMSYYGRGGVSTDFVGLARRKIASKVADRLHFYVSGCSGNVTAGKYNDGAEANRESLAERLFTAMQAALKAEKKTAVESVQFRSVPLKLQAREGGEFTKEALEKRLTAETPRSFNQCLAALGLSWQKRVQAGQAVDLPVLDFGGAVLMVLPAESYVEYQIFAQEQRRKDFVQVAGYGECGPGYIPNERAWKEKDGNLTDWCWVPPGSQKVMEEAIQAALKK